MIESRVAACGGVENEWKEPQGNFIKVHGMKCLKSVHFTVHKPQNKEIRLYVTGGQLVWFLSLSTDTYMQRPLVLLKGKRLETVAFLRTKETGAGLLSAFLHRHRTSEAGEDLCTDEMDIRGLLVLPSYMSLNQSLPVLDTSFLILKERVWM